MKFFKQGRSVTFFSRHPNADFRLFSSMAQTVTQILEKEYHGDDESPPSSSSSPQRCSPPISEHRKAFVEETMVAVNAIVHGLQADTRRTATSRPAQNMSNVQTEEPAMRSSYAVYRFLLDMLNTKSWISRDTEMRKHNIVLRPTQVAWVLQVQTDPFKALDFFNWATRRSGYSHDQNCFAIMIDILGRSSQYRLLDNLLDEMQKLQMPQSSSTLHRLIEIYAARDKVDKVAAFYSKVMEQKWEPNHSAQKCMVEAFARSGQCEKALEMYVKMEGKQLPCDVDSYNILLEELSCKGMVELAQHVFQGMKQSIADVSSYSTMVATLVHAGMSIEAMELVEEMLKNGFRLSKDACGSLLDALGRQGNLEIGIKLFKRMAKEDVIPDFVTCQSVLELLCKGTRVGRTLELAQCVRKKAAKEELYESLIKVLGNMGYAQEVFALFQKLKKDRIKPGHGVFVGMIDAFCSVGYPMEALKIMEEMEKSYDRPHIGTYNSIMAALCNCDRLLLAYDLFREIRRKGVAPDTESYNIIIPGLCRDGNMPRAECVFEEMDKSGCTVNADTINALLGTFAELGDVNSTKKYLELMQLRAVPPNVDTYNSAIECFSRAGMPKVALQIFQEMRLQGCSPTTCTYNRVLLALDRGGMSNAVLMHFRQMKMQGFVPDASTYSVIVDVYDKCPELDKSQLVKEIQNAGLL